jgi:hypothetical protein
VISGELLATPPGGFVIFLVWRGIGDAFALMSSWNGCTLCHWAGPSLALVSLC